MNMLPHERALALAMYREELSEMNSDSGDWPAGISTNLGQLDLQAEKMIRYEWNNVSPVRQAELLRGIGAEVLLAIKAEAE